MENSRVRAATGEVQQTDIAVVGAGPAGLTAAIEAARAGARVTLVDENSRPGGQLVKQIHKFFGSKDHRAGIRGIQIGQDLLAEADAAGVDVALNTVAYGLYDGMRIGLVCNGRSFALQARAIILATGASERVVPFDGWTLPGVMGAGAIQTLMNTHRTLPGRRVLIVGAGNVGLIVAYQILQAGAEVVAIVDGLPYIGGYGVHASKVRRAGVCILVSHTLLSVKGSEDVEQATIVAVDDDWEPVTGTEKTLDVDTVGLAVGLTPLAELAWIAGCRFEYVAELGGHTPVHDCNMETTLPGIFVAGDAAGVEEASTAMEEGRLAGLAVAERLGYLQEADAERKKDEVRTRLSMLRLGSFGEERAMAKTRILEARDKWQ